MKNKTTPHANILDALQLNGEPQAIVDYYKGWARTYNDDVHENYYGISFIAQLLHNSLQQTDRANPDNTHIVDVGCGTGLLAPTLHSHGLRRLDGIDLSEEMIAVARETGLYESLHAGIDLHQPLPAHLTQRYDATVCLGVFTPGHVAADALYQLIKLSKPGGIVITSTRVPYYNQTNYQAVTDTLIDTGAVRLNNRYFDAPYRDDGDAHYWVYEVR